MYRGRKIAVVIPAYNERLRVAGVLETIPAFVDRIIVVDDGSTDDTAARIPREACVRTEVIRRAMNGGVGAAIVTGYRRALETDAELVAVMAGDGQMDPADLPALLDPLIAGSADYAKGDRLSHPDVLHEMPGFRLFGNSVLTLATRFATGLPVHDSQCGYTAFTREALERIPLDDLYPRYGFPNDLLLKAAAQGLRVKDVTVRPIYHAGPNVSGIRLRSFMPRVSWLLLAGTTRRLMRRGEWARKEKVTRVAVLTSSYPRHAEDHAGHFVAALAEEWSRDAAVTVVAPWDGSAPRIEEDTVSGLRVRRFRYAPRAAWHRVAYGAGIEENLAGPLARLWLAPFLAAFLLRGLREIRRADVVVSHWLLPAGLAGALGRALFGKPHLLIEHGGGLSALTAGRLSGARGRLLRTILGGTDRTVCVSAKLRGDLVTAAAAAGRAVHARDVPVIRMGISGPAPGPKTWPRERSVIFIGRLVRVKGVEVLIEAMETVPDATLTIAGAGPMEASLRQRAAKIAARVAFPGILHGEAKNAALSRAPILAVPSVVLPGGRTEGFPIVVLEGMAAGCVVIASDVGGIGEVLQDGWNGFLVKAGDANALAEKIRWVLDHPELTRPMAKRARENALAHDAGTVARRLRLEIDRLLFGQRA